MEKLPFVTKEKAEEIAAQFPTPFHLYDERGIRENAAKLKEAFAWNKGYKEFFAVKATPNPFLINILREYGCGCDCSSKTELMLSKTIGAVGEDIMFSSNDTPLEEFKYCNDLGGIINLDDITHIEAVEKACGKLPRKMSCRYNPGGMFKITKDIMDNPGDAKYGMTTEQLFEAFRIMKSKGVEEFGLHAFLCSNTVTNEYYPLLAKVLFDCNVLARQALCDTSAGYIARDTHRNTTWQQARFECCHHKWCDLSETDGGVAILNDGKYGVVFLENQISLSLLRSPIRPDVTADMGHHSFCYRIVPHAGDPVQAGINRRALQFNQPPIKSDVAYNGTDFAPLYLQAMKFSEDGERSVVRLSEQDGRRGTLRLPRKVQVLNMLEDVERETDSVDYTPFEILTLGWPVE